MAAEKQYRVKVTGQLPAGFAGVREAVVDAHSPYHAQGIVCSTWPEYMIRQGILPEMTVELEGN